MDVRKSQQGQVAILSIDGAMTSDDLGVLDVAAEECLNSGLVKIVLDLSRVPFIESLGLERIQTIVLNAGKRGGDVRIASPNDVCRDTLLVTRMDSLVQVFEEREAAVRSLL